MTTHGTHQTQTVNSKNHLPTKEDEYTSESSKEDLPNIITNDLPLNPQNVLTMQSLLGNQATINLINRKETSESKVKSQPFAGLKMVQREPKDNENKSSKEDKEESTEADQSDSDASEQDDQIESLVQEAAKIEKIVAQSKQVQVDKQNADNDKDVKKPSNADDVGADLDDDDSNKKKVPQAPGTVVKGKQIASSGIVGTSVQTVKGGADIGLIVNYATTWKDMIEEKAILHNTGTGIDKALTWLQKLVELATQLGLPLLTFGMAVKAAVNRYRYAKSYDKLMEGQKDNSKAANKKVDIGSYGAEKTIRGTIINTFRAIASAGSFVAHLLTLLTGGVASLISETTAVALGLGKIAIRAGQLIKGAWKAFRGKRGKERLKNANTIVDMAIKGDEDMLQLLLDLNVFDTMWIWRLKRKGLYGKDVVMHNWKSRGLANSNDFEKINKAQHEFEQAKDVKVDRRIEIKHLKILKSKPETIDELKTYLKVAKSANALTDITKALADKENGGAGDIKMRLEMAKNVVNGAFKGESFMLQRILSLNVFDNMKKSRSKYARTHARKVAAHHTKSMLKGNKDTGPKLEFEQAKEEKAERRIKLKYSKALLVKPKTTDDMKKYLELALEADTLVDFKETIADTMKSS